MNNSSRKASALHLSSKWLKSSKRWERNQKGCGKKMAKLVKFSNLIMIVSFPLCHLVSNCGALIYQSHKRKIKITKKLNRNKRKNVNDHCLIVQLEDKWVTSLKSLKRKRVQTGEPTLKAKALRLIQSLTQLKFSILFWKDT